MEGKLCRFFSNIVCRLKKCTVDDCAGCYIRKMSFKTVTPLVLALRLRHEAVQRRGLMAPSNMPSGTKRIENV